jgi:hypothetical protein
VSREHVPTRDDIFPAIYIILLNSTQCSMWQCTVTISRIKEEVFGGFHLFITVVDCALSSQANSSVQNVVAQKQVSGT